MGTRSRIGIQLSDDSILSVYHHWDGYPTWLGKVLNTHYSTKEKVAELIDGGDMSSAYTNCGWNNETRPESGPMYYSERGDDCPPRLDNNIVEYLANGEEYAYIFNRKSEWVAFDRHEFDDKTPEVVHIPSGALA
jgi:hypothetical protein